MAEESNDPREVTWHPRLTRRVIGHQAAELRVRQAFDSGKMHHAWLVAGQKGIGKATFAYRMAAYALSLSDQGIDRGAAGLDVPWTSRTIHWMDARAHPDFFVLERLWDGKTKKLKAEISVENARALTDFFGLTAGSGGWRVAIIDVADDLNISAANALLKLIEEPPPNCLLILVSHQPGRLLRTIRSRCMRLDLQPLTAVETQEVLANLPLDEPPTAAELGMAATLSDGSPGRGLELLTSAGAKSFNAFLNLARLTPQALVEFGGRFGSRVSNSDDFDIFCDLLERWMGREARSRALAGQGGAMAEAFSAVSRSIRETNELNLDRRQTVIHALSLIEEARKSA